MGKSLELTFLSWPFKSQRVQYFLLTTRYNNLRVQMSWIRGMQVSVSDESFIFKLLDIQKTKRHFVLPYVGVWLGTNMTAYPNSGEINRLQRSRSPESGNETVQLQFYFSTSQSYWEKLTFVGNQSIQSLVTAYHHGDAHKLFRHVHPMWLRTYQLFSHLFKLREQK